MCLVWEAEIHLGRALDVPGSSYEFHGIGHGVMARRSATPPSKSHGLVGNFHIIGTISMGC